jgi:hypothetical protein
MIAQRMLKAYAALGKALLRIGNAYSRGRKGGSIYDNG